MSEGHHRIVRAWIESPHRGLIELDRDWTAASAPRFSLGGQCPLPSGLRPAPLGVAARTYGYVCLGNRELTVLLPLALGSGLDPAHEPVYLAGDFNGWSEARGREEWQLHPEEIDGERLLVWRGAAARCFTSEQPRFKFVTAEHRWLLPPEEAPNTVRDAQGNVNRFLDARRTGRHLWEFTSSEALDLSRSWRVDWALRGESAGVPMVPGRFFYELRSDLPLGAIVRGDCTLFRLFAPRATSVLLEVTNDPAGRGGWRVYPLQRRPDGEGASGVWETTLDQDLHGWCYGYRLSGEGEAGFDPAVRVLDPYAWASVGAEGPGVVVSAARVGRADRSFRTPPWQDLVIAEAHVRDLAALAPTAATAGERLGFSGLTRWVEHSAFHLARLGVNCVELQPVQQFDAVTQEEYHWGYMPNAYLAPASAYSLEPRQASGLAELRELVAAFHRRGMAVILDVVFNHVGVPAHLMRIDRRYYFEQDADGQLTNWSGCGNDLRARSAMATRLIIDSCVHFIEVFGVDGFRFDLAELLGVEVLREVESALKRVKPDVILIAEPWSFRGHIAGALRDTGWASWNDGYRDFVRDYVLGRGGAERLAYFLRGSPWYFAKWPAQTINYTESHDDRTWIDVITENGDGDGFSPTVNDIRRTHLMAAVLFMSVGVPMIAAGQDFLRSKHGVNNTYLRGDLNALDYRRWRQHQATHAYFAEWIAFRRSELGRLVRQWSRPAEGFFAFVHQPDSPALVVVFNADHSQGAQRLLFGINPTGGEITVPLPEQLRADHPEGWCQLADHQRFYPRQGPGCPMPVHGEVSLPALGCGLWVAQA